MKITMKSTVAGSTGHDGVQIYREGKTYSIADSLAAQFIRRGQAINLESTIEEDVNNLVLRCEYQHALNTEFLPPTYENWLIARQNKIAAESTLEEVLG